MTKFLKKILSLLFYGIYSERNVIFRNNVSTDIHKTSKIFLNEGQLYINKSWVKKDPFPSLFVMKRNATLRVSGIFSFYSGSKIYINENAELNLGSGYINSNLNLSCFEKIEIGENVVISENVVIRDSDNHSFGGNLKITKPIKIKDNVWIGINVTILKGVTIGQGSIIAAGSLVNKDVPDGCLAGGIPAKILRKNVSWK